MRATYGHAGWVQVTDEGLPGPLYLRFTEQPSGRLTVTELYLDGRGTPIRAETLRTLRLADLEAFITGDAHILRAWIDNAGPDLSRLASHFAANWLRQPKLPEEQLNWIADSFLAQYEDTGVPQASRARERRGDQQPPVPPLAAPTEGLTDDFLRHVGAAYRAAVMRGERPGPTLSRQAQVPVKTVHRWVYLARQRGIMPPGQQGRVT